MGTFSRSWSLVEQSFAVLRQNRSLVWFPILSGICELLVIISFVLPIWYFLNFDVSQTGEGYSGYSYYLIVFLFYFINFFIITFFNVGLVYCAHKNLHGEKTTFKEGLDFALSNIKKIFAWVLLAATIGTILRVISDKAGILGKIFSGVAGIAWGLVTFLIVPVLIFENKSVVDSAKFSVELFKKTWGEQISGRISMNVVFLFFGIIPFPLIVILLYFLSTIGIFSLSLLVTMGIVYFFYILFLMVLSTSLNGIFTAVLYMYANDKTIPSSFNQDLIKGAFKLKKSDKPTSSTSE